MKKGISYEEIEEDLAELKRALEKIEKDDSVDKALNNLIENVKSQAAELQKRTKELEGLSAIVDNAGIPLVLSDLSGKWEYVNPMFEKFFGFKREEVLGKSIFEIPMITEEAKKTIPKERELYGKKDVVEYEIPFKKKSGEVAQILITQTCVRNKNREVINWVFELKDITELREREEELKKSNEFNQMIVENVPALIWMADSK